MFEKSKVEETGIPSYMYMKKSCFLQCTVQRHRDKMLCDIIISLLYY